MRSKPVNSAGIGLKIQKIKHRANIPSICMPTGSKPHTGGQNQRTRRAAIPKTKPIFSDVFPRNFFGGRPPGPPPGFPPGRSFFDCAGFSTAAAWMLTSPEPAFAATGFPPITNLLVSLRERPPPSTVKTSVEQVNGRGRKASSLPTAPGSTISLAQKLRHYLTASWE